MTIQRRMACIAILLCTAFLIPLAVPAQQHAEREKKRMEENARFDKQKLREKTDFVVDKSEKFLQPPADAKEKPAGDYIVAKVPPTVKLRIAPNMIPEYFTDEGLQYMAGWANWGYVTRSVDNRFYFSVGDHKGMGCQLNIYEYCPARNLLHRVVDVSKLLGWTDKTYTDGKIHGEMGIDHVVRQGASAIPVVSFPAPCKMIFPQMRFTSAIPRRLTLTP